MSSFSSHAALYNYFGLTPLPVIDKKPCAKVFNKWKGLGPIAVESLSEDFPRAELAILTRLSGLIIVDVDSKEADLYTWVIDEFGWTPLVVETKRGFHLYYSNPNGIRGVIGDGTYRVDIKGAGTGDFVVAPPSKGYEFVEIYLDKEPPNFGCRGIEDFLELYRKGLPPINPAGVDVFFPNHLKKCDKGAAVSRKPQAANDRADRTAVRGSEAVSRAVTVIIDDKANVLPQGTRNTGLWRRGMFYSDKLAQQKGLTEETRISLESYLQELNLDVCQPPLDNNEVSRIANNIWYNYQLTGMNNVNHCASNIFLAKVASSPEIIVKALAQPSIFFLLQWLKSAHEVDHPFCLNRTGLARILDTTEYIIRKAKKYLLDNGYIEQVTPHDWRKKLAATFIFTEKTNRLITRIPDDEPGNDNDIEPPVSSRA